MLCPPGYMCTRQITADPCRQGYYCTGSTGYDIQPCPEGKFGSREGLTSESECSDCTGGHYCEGTGLPDETGGCDAGHYCQSGVNVKAPTGSGHTGIGNLCFAGHECPANTSYPNPCKHGTYASTTGMSKCLECPEGSYMSIRFDFCSLVLSSSTL